MINKLIDLHRRSTIATVGPESVLTAPVDALAMLIVSQIARHQHAKKSKTNILMRLMQSMKLQNYTSINIMFVNKLSKMRQKLMESSESLTRDTPLTIISDARG